MKILYIDFGNVVSDNHVYQYYGDLFRELRALTQIYLLQGVPTNINDVLKQIEGNVDCIIFSGVLLYETDHYKMFKDTMSFYNCEHAIIQEPYHTQKHYDTRLVLKTITEDMSQYNFKEEFIIDADIFCGRRLIAHI